MTELVAEYKRDDGAPGVPTIDRTELVLDPATLAGDRAAETQASLYPIDAFEEGTPLPQMPAAGYGLPHPGDLGMHRPY